MSSISRGPEPYVGGDLAVLVCRSKMPNGGAGWPRSELILVRLAEAAGNQVQGNTTAESWRGFAQAAVGGLPPI
jgi:hypothetical protein